MKELITVSLALISIWLSSCTEDIHAPSNKYISIQINGLQLESNVLSLRIMDDFGRSFDEIKSSNTGGEHQFDYRSYRPIIAQLRINEKENNIFIEPTKHQYTYTLDSNGYLKPMDVYHEYINSLRYLLDQDCVNEKDLPDGILCIDKFSERKRELLEVYGAKGMTDYHYEREDTEIYYNRYKQYARLSLTRYGRYGIEEDNSIVFDSIASMDLNYGDAERSTNRANALTFQSLLNRRLDDDVKKYNYHSFRNLYHIYPDDPFIATHILASLHDNPYRQRSLIDSLTKSSIPEFVEGLKLESKIGASYSFNNNYWNDIEGDFITDASLTNRVSLINFWFPGCKPCISSIPQKNELVEHYKSDHKFQLLNINSDFSRDIWLQSLDRYDMKGEHYNVPEALQESHDAYYELKSFPTYMLAIDGRVERIEQYPIGSQDLLIIIDKVLNEVSSNIE